MGAPPVNLVFVLSRRFFYSDSEGSNIFHSGQLCNQGVETTGGSAAFNNISNQETYKGWTLLNENSLTDAKIRDVPISSTVLNRHKIPITSSHIRNFLRVTETSKRSRRYLQSAPIANFLRQTGSLHSGLSGVADSIRFRSDIASVISFSNWRARLILSFGMSTTARRAYTGTTGKHGSQKSNGYWLTLRDGPSVPITLIH